MKKITNYIAISAVLAGMTVMSGCDKSKPYKIDVVPELVHFVGNASQNYTLLTPQTPAFTVTIGTTNVSDQDRTATVTISSPTGATAGNQYTLNGFGTGTLTIPAGQAVASFTIQGDFDSYTMGRKDTLIISLKEPNTAVADYFDTLKVALRGPCFETDIVINEMVGPYPNSFDPGYGPYQTSVKSITSTGPTSADVVIGNIYDWGWTDLTFHMDWSDPSDTKITFDPQNTGMDAGNLNSAVAGHAAWIYPPTGGASAGTYSYCDKTFTLTYRICMPTFGACFTGTTTTTMAK